MKTLSFLLLFAPVFCAKAQFFSFQQKWFENESFFIDSAISQQKIAAIHIWQGEKKDGQKFKSERAFLHYEFNKTGKLSASYKSVALKNKIDTATFLFSYNQKGQLYKQSEQQGLFHFNYFYFYENDKVVKEIKMDVANNDIDTTDLQFFNYSSTNNTTRTTTLNALKKPFLYLDKDFNDNGKLIRETKSYHRNQGFTETTYIYTEGKLLRVEKSIDGNSMPQKITIARKNERLELVSFFEAEKLVKKYAFTYHLNDLPKAIIERDLVEKKIIVYRLEYLFYRD